MITSDCLSALPQTDHTTFSLRRVPLAYGETFGDLSHGSTPLPLWLLTQIFDHRSTTNIANNTSNIGHKKEIITTTTGEKTGCNSCDNIRIQILNRQQFSHSILTFKTHTCNTDLTKTRQSVDKLILSQDFAGKQTKNALKIQLK